MSGSGWYFHIDTAIDDCAPGTSPIDQLVTRPRLERVLLMCLWLYEGLGRRVETDVGERWSLSSKFYGKTLELCCCDVLGQKFTAVKTAKV